MIAATTFSSVADVLSRLGDVRETGNPEWQWSARCPVPEHGDRNPSQSVGEDPDGRLKLHCFKGCERKAILDSLNLTDHSAASSNGHHTNGASKKKPNKKQSSKASPKHAAGLRHDQLVLKPERDREWIEELASKKPGFTARAIQMAGGRAALWPGFLGENAHRVIVHFTGLPWVSNKPIGAVMYRADGEMFPAVPEAGLDERKVHTLRGSKDSLAIGCTLARLESAKVLHIVEGPGDMIALTPFLTESEAVVSSLCGADSFGKELELVFVNRELVVVWGDTDHAGVKGKLLRANKAVGQAKSVKAPDLPYPIESKKGKDLRDWLVEGKTREDIQKLIEVTQPYKPALPKVVLDFDEGKVVDQAIVALADAENLYQRGGLLVQTVRNAKFLEFLKQSQDAPRIVSIEMPRLREILSTVATWHKKASDGILEQTAVNQEIVKEVAARGMWDGIPPIEGVVEHPVMRSDGSILRDPGYDDTTGLLCTSTVNLPAMKDSPTKADAHAACLELLDVFCDFPFAGDIYKSACLAAVLAPFARHAYDGCTPLHLVDKNTRGTGGGLLVNAISTIFSGRSMDVMSAPESDAECRKRITTIAIEGIACVNIDNIVGTFGYPSLDACLTSVYWSDRLMQVNKTARARMVTIWYATANNVSIKADTARRSLHIRLETKEEKPEERDTFTHPDLLGWIRKNRGDLCRAALTILRAYFVAGSPSQGIKPWGSFEGWSNLVRQSIVWAGLPDPGGTRAELAKQSDVETAAAEALLKAWADTYGEDGATAAEAIEHVRLADRSHKNPEEKYTALRVAILNAAPPRSGDLPSQKSLGMKLHHLRRKVVGGKRFEGTTEHGITRWAVK